MRQFCRLRIGAIGLVEAQALANFLSEALCDTVYAVRRDAGKVRAVDRLGIVESRKQQLQQVFADRGDCPLGRKICSIYMVDASSRVVRGQNGFRDFSEVAVHLDR